MALKTFITGLLANIILFNVVPVMAQGRNTNFSVNPLTVTATVTVTAAAQPTFGRGLPSGCSLPVGFPLGCWLEIGTGRVLPEAWFEDKNKMTTELCAQLCNSYTLFGVEYSSQYVLPCTSTSTSGLGWLSSAPTTSHRIESGPVSLSLWPVSLTHGVIDASVPTASMPSKVSQWMSRSAICPM